MLAFRGVFRQKLVFLKILPEARGPFLENAMEKELPLPKFGKKDSRPFKKNSKLRKLSKDKKRIQKKTKNSKKEFKKFFKKIFLKRRNATKGFFQAENALK